MLFENGRAFIIHKNHTDEMIKFLDGSHRIVYYMSSIRPLLCDTREFIIDMDRIDDMDLMALEGFVKRFGNPFER